MSDYYTRVQSEDRWEALGETEKEAMRKTVRDEAEANGLLLQPDDRPVASVKRLGWGYWLMWNAVPNAS